MDAAVLKLSSALGDTKYHPGAPSAKGRGRKFANYEDIVEAGAQAIIGMSKEIAARNVVLGRAAKCIVDMGSRLQDVVEVGRDNETDPLKIAKLWLEIKRQPAPEAMDILAQAVLGMQEEMDRGFSEMAKQLMAKATHLQQNAQIIGDLRVKVTALHTQVKAQCAALEFYADPEIYGWQNIKLARETLDAFPAMHEGCSNKAALAATQKKAPHVERDGAN